MEHVRIVDDAVLMGDRCRRFLFSDVNWRIGSAIVRVEMGRIGWRRTGRLLGRIGSRCVNRRTWRRFHRPLRRIIRSRRHLRPAVFFKIPANFFRSLRRLSFSWCRMDDESIHLTPQHARMERRLCFLLLR